MTDRPRKSRRKSTPRTARPTAGRTSKKKSARRPRTGVPDALTDKQRGRRLQKVLAEAGIASRRDCEDLILDGRVKVNGEPVTALPAWVDPDVDRVEVDGEPVRGTGRSGKRRRKQAGAVREHTAADQLVYVALHKPKRVICTTRDPEGRTPVTELVELPPPAPGVKPPRLFPVGRLDAESTGLILLTNDGDLANRLTHPKFGVVKQYRVSVRGRLDDEQLQALRDGIHLADRRATGRRGKTGTERPGAKRATMSQVKRIGSRPGGKTTQASTELLVTLREGQNREIRRMLARLGFKVKRLHRVKIGPLSVKGLAVGQWRLLSKTQVDRLYKAARDPDDAA